VPPTKEAIMKAAGAAMKKGERICIEPSFGQRHLTRVAHDTTTPSRAHDGRSSPSPIAISHRHLPSPSPIAISHRHLPGELKITFQFPLEEGQQHCSACDKFVEEAEFEGASVGLDAGPGKQVCASCEEYGDMF
jgi:hypothetical protein